MWRDRGFDLTAADVIAIDQFFDEWFETYNRDGLSLYRSQESLFASHVCLEALSEIGPPGKKNRGWVSSIRMGYAVAVCERERGDRTKGDLNVAALFEAKELHEKWPADAGMERAFVAGQDLGKTALDLLLTKEDLLHKAEGFSLREPVFADIRGSLMFKHVVQSRKFTRDSGEALVRAGHALGWLEESLTRTIAPQNTG
jgi:hypothetical protein